MSETDRVMCTARVKHTEGLSLVEVMVAAVIVTIMATGVLAYEYLSAIHVRLAHAELAATRIGQLLLEDWKSTGGQDLSSYDAVTLGIGFEVPSAGESWHYAITIDGVRLYIWLSQTDIATDSIAGVTLRQIAATVQWRRDLSSGPVDSDDPSAVLTTYVRRDQD